MVFFRKFYKRFCFFTIANVYLVILAGGVVRCTGSGMGCPDWPKCFGKWIPPTTISDLPSNYVDLYSDNGHLTVEFNFYKTWTEYINRLLGVLVGISIFFTLVFSLGYWKTNRSIFYLSLISFVLVGLQGWIGAKVVATNLKPVMITIHMFIALLIVALLIRAFAIKSVSELLIHRFKGFKLFRGLTLILCILVMIQILIGTQVRQWVDEYLSLHSSKVGMFTTTGIMFNMHVVCAYLVVLLTCFLIYRLYQSKSQYPVMWLMLFCITVEYLGGIVMYRFDLPRFMQPIHLICASLLFGLSFYLYSIFSLSENIESIGIEPE